MDAKIMVNNTKKKKKTKIKHFNSLVKTLSNKYKPKPKK